MCRIASIKSDSKIASAERKKKVTKIKMKCVLLLFVIFGVIALTCATKSNDFQEDLDNLVELISPVLTGVLGSEIGEAVICLIFALLDVLYPALNALLGDALGAIL